MFRILYQPYKWLIYTSIVGILTAVMSIGCLLLCLVNQRWGSRYVATPWTKILFLVIPASVEVKGEEYIDKTQSYVVVANHMSIFDICVLYGWLDLDLKWVMKKELRKVPCVGFCCAAMGHIFLDRKDKSAAATVLKEVKAKLTDGTSVLFFPEGTRSLDGRLKHFKRGAFMTAKELDLPILPITVLGTNNIMPSGTIDLMPGKAEMIIHPPITVDRVRQLDEQALLQEAHDTIAASMVT